MRSYLLIATVLLCFVSVPVFCQDSRAAALSPKQIASLKSIQAETEKRAAPLVIELAATAKDVFANMLADRENQRLRRRLALKLHQITGSLLDIKGQSYRDMLATLTLDQKRMVREAVAKPGSPADLGEVIKGVFDLSR